MSSSGNPQDLSVQECLEAFHLKDFIMEPSVIEFLNTYVLKGGTPEDAIQNLSSSYVALAQMVNLLADWMVHLGITPLEIQNLIENHFYSLVIKHFDPKKADKIFNTEGKVPDWLGGLVENNKWRKMIYDLAEEYPDCLMLNLTVKLIAESGFQGEITGVATASQQLEVFSGVLNTTIGNVVSDVGVNFVKNINELSSIVKYAEHSFLYSVVLLSYLAESPYGGSIAERIKQEVFKSTVGTQNSMDITALNFLVNKVPLHSRAVQAMGSMLSKNQLNPADVTVLYKMYQIVSTAHENVPPVSLLRDPQFLNLMMSALFCKTCKINPDHKPKYIYLLAYAVSVFECWKAGRNDKYNRTSLNSTDLTPTVKAIEKAGNILSQKGSGRELVQEVVTLFDCMKFPVVSCGVILWVEEVVQDESFYDRNTDQTPVPLLLLDEIVNLHVLQHRQVFDLLQKLFLNSFSSLSAYARLELQKVIVDRCIHLVCNNFVIPVIDFFAECVKNRSTDTSLVRYFLFHLLDLIGPPFSSDFVGAIKPLCLDDSLSDAVNVKVNENDDVRELMSLIEDCDC